jgi:hypothetical protein
MKVRSSWQITRLLADHRKITAVMKSAARAAIRQHALAGNPIAESRDGKVVWIQPRDLLVDEKTIRCPKRTRSR